MWSTLRNFTHVIRSFVFTSVLHGALILLLLYSFDWIEQVERVGRSEPIQAVAISDQVLKERARKKQAAIEQKRLEAEKKIAEEKKRKADEAKKLAEQKKIAEEKKRKVAEEKKRAEEKKIAEEKKRAEEKKAAEEKKLAEEKERKDAEEKGRAEEKKRAEELQKQLEQGKIKDEANEALRAYIERIRVAVENQWRRPDFTQAGLTAIIRVRVAPNGRVISARVTTSSGDAFFDRSGEDAVRRASPLPFPPNPKFYEFIDEFNVKFSPDEF